MIYLIYLPDVLIHSTIKVCKKAIAADLRNRSDRPSCPSEIEGVYTPKTQESKENQGSYQN